MENNSWNVGYPFRCPRDQQSLRLRGQVLELVNRYLVLGQVPELANRYLVQEQAPEFRQRAQAQARERYRWMPVR
jgi:hypothetical protein